MGLLTRSVLACLTSSSVGCYEPEVRDCTLACSATSECASGQTCGSDGFCAGPELAGNCFEPYRRDGGTSVSADATVITPPGDAAVDAAPDAPTQGTIFVTIAGKGHVTIYGVGTCDSDPPQEGSCAFSVKLGQLVTAQASGEWEWYFDEWTTSVCPAEQLSTCSFTVGPVVQLGAKFRKGDGDEGDD